MSDVLWVCGLTDPYGLAANPAKRGVGRRAPPLQKNIDFILCLLSIRCADRSSSLDERRSCRRRDGTVGFRPVWAPLQGWESPYGSSIGRRRSIDPYGDYIESLLRNREAFFVVKGAK